MKKYLLITTLMIFGGFTLTGYAQEEVIWEFEKAAKQSSNSSYSDFTVANSMAFLQDGEQTEQQGQRQEGEQENENQEGEMGENEGKLPVQPLPLENEDAREESTKGETPFSIFSIQNPEGSVREENIAPPAPAAIEKKNEDDSVLSFNFLYLLIQKFKLSDIMED